MGGQWGAGWEGGAEGGGGRGKAGGWGEVLVGGGWVLGLREWEGEGSVGVRTADGGFFVLLEFVVDESEDEGGLRRRGSVVVLIVWSGRHRPFRLQLRRAGPA